MEVNGVPNTRLDAGAILALTPLVAASPATVTLLNGWGPGAFDIRFDLSALQGNQLNPLEDLVDNPTSNPPIWNFISLEQQGYLFGWDGLFENDGINNNALASQAEAVYDLVMHANGAFGTPLGNLPPELRIAPPPDLVAGLEAAEAPLTGQPGNFIDTGKLLEVQTWMRSLVSPPPGPFNETLAQQGFTLFHGRAQCNVCHQTEHFTGPGLFTDITATPPAGGLAGGIKVPGLKGISRTAPYFHDHSAATLEEAVTRFVVRGDPVPLLTLDEEAALVEYLRSL
jgi:hypothetical protein